MSPPPGGTDRATTPPSAPPPTALTPIAPPPVALPVEPPPSPLEWLAARSLLDPTPEPSVPASSLPEVPPRRRRRDDEPPQDVRDPAVAATEQRPAVPASAPRVRIDDRGGYRVAVRDVEPPEPTTQDNRLAEILAENGGSPASGRRRRRYRNEDEPDDVLSRVLGRN
jgi:hypothetical protein